MTKPMKKLEFRQFQSRRCSVDVNMCRMMVSAVVLTCRRFSLGRPSNRGGQAVDTRSSPALCTVALEEDENSVPFLRKHDQFGRVVLNKTLKNGQYEITAGTLEALVEALADEKTPDTIYIEVFLLTFRHFTTPARVLELLHKRFHFESEDVRTAAVVRLRTVSVLKKWAERHYYDFRFSEVQALLGSFLDSIASTECAKFGVQIKSIIDAELERSKTFVAPAKPQAPKQIAAILAGVDFLSSTFTAKRIAQELILEDLRLFKQIKPDEFCIFL